MVVPSLLSKSVKPVFWSTTCKVNFLICSWQILNVSNSILKTKLNNKTCDGSALLALSCKKNCYDSRALVTFAKVQTAAADNTLGLASHKTAMLNARNSYHFCWYSK
jgi:hypothetical protein